MGRPREFDTAVALDVALDAFWSQGFEATSIEQLCRGMDLAPASVYAAFGNKRALFVEAIRRYMDVVSTQAIDLIGSAPSGLGGIRSYFAHLVDAMVDGKRRWGCLVTNSMVEFASRDAELSGIFQTHLARLEAAFAAALARARDAGEVGGDANDRAAAYLVTVVQGLNVLARTRPRREVLEGIAAMAIAGLAAPGPATKAGRAAIARKPGG
jgi:TetR/AcrR family transcriptional regulator, transcriptional repressor for nem operon